MENGILVEQGRNSPIASVGTDSDVYDAVRILVSAGADPESEVVWGLSSGTDVPGGDFADGIVEEDVYSMDVRDELAKRYRFSVTESIVTAASANPVIDVEVSSKVDSLLSTGSIKSTMESEVSTERCSASDIAAAEAIAVSKGEISKLEPRNLCDRTIRACPSVLHLDILQAAEFSEVSQDALGEVNAAKAEIGSRAVLGSKNGLSEALKCAEDTKCNMTALRTVKAGEAKAMDDVEAKLVTLAACGTSCMPGIEPESSRAVVHRESEALQVVIDSKGLGQPSCRIEESSGSRSWTNMAGGMVVEAMNSVPEGSQVEEEHARLLGVPIVEQQQEQVKDSQNDKKRALDLPSPELQRKLSRLPGDERKIDEDVCFICFDGGDLVLCDRRSCPKAYHLSCIGRDAAFFKKKGAWLCGWHFCSVCTKPGSFQCYTCPTAYCGMCINNAEFRLLRKRKGLCEDCLPIVSMIERDETINADGVEVDFEDQETYECLFKEYWGDLKRRLSLVVPELGTDGKLVSGNSSMLNDGSSESEDYSCDDESDNEIDESKHHHPESLGAAGMKKRANKNRMASDGIYEGMDPEDECEGDHELLHVFGSQKFEGWASKELLVFIEHMKEDPSKPLSRFAVNKLLWSYIKRHKLQDSRKSSQIHCDERLKRIFGKESVGQFEMFKHLQVHFPATSSIDSSKSKDVQDCHNEMTEEDAIDVDGIEGKVGTGSAKERRRGRRSADEKFERPNCSDYAAITPKNMDLIYLRRALLRDLLEDLEFDDKVVDTFVRIRVPGISTKTETTYRLVQVTGTRIGEESYKAGTKTTNIVLEILNLQKKEDVTVDLVSNQDFTEEECQRLRQSIKCGFIKALTVGDVEDKAIALREAKVNDWFENERQRLINLRDRASEKGRKKELRECVEKLQELGSPAFRAAKLQAKPEVTADPHMDPGYESDVNQVSPFQGGRRKFRPKVSPRGGLGKGTGCGSSNWDGSKLEDSLSLGRKVNFDNQRPKSWEETGRSSRGSGRVEFGGGRNGESLGLVRESAFGVDGKLYSNDERDRPRVWDQSREQDRTRGDAFNWNGNGGRIDMDQFTAELGDLKYGRGEARAGSSPIFGQARSEWGSSRGDAAPSNPLSSLASGYCATSPSLQNLTVLDDKLWHYQDPTGVVQGPFTMEQLRKWSMTGLFPANLAIWKTGQVQENSMLLTDALAGRFKEELWTAPRNKARDFVACESLTAWGGPSWSGGDSERCASRAEQVQLAGGSACDSCTVERGRNWVRGQSSYSGAQLSTGRPDDWTSSRSRAELNTGSSSRKGADGGSWGGNESGKSTYNRSTSIRDHDAAAVRDGYRIGRGPRGSKKDVICRFYAKGYCKRGDSCEFWHG